MKLKRTLSVWAALLAMAIPVLSRADEPGTMQHPEKPGTVNVPAAEPAAEEKDWSIKTDFTLYSEYIFRGVDLSGDDIMLSPSATFGWKGFSAYYWGAFNDSDSPPNNWYEETDLGVDYTHAFFDDKLSLTGGALWYLYLDGLSGPDTVELYVKASYDVLLTPTVSLFYDIDEFHGGYLTFSISHSFDIGTPLGLPEGQSLSVDPSAALSYDLGYNSRATQSNFQPNDVLLGVSVPWQITEHICVHAGVQVSVALDSLNDIGQHNELIGNGGVTVSF